MPYTLKNALILDPRSGHFQKRADILIDRGVIQKISKTIKASGRVIDLPNLGISPGWIDMNVRINDPGFEYKETLDQTIDLAKKGGFTSIVTLPDTNPLIQTKDQINSLIQKGRKRNINIHPLAALTEDQKEERLNDLMDLMNSGAVGFSDSDSSHDPEIVSNALRYLDGSKGFLFAKPSDPSLSNGAQVNEGLMSTKLGFKGFSPESESLRLSRDLDLLRMNGGRIHFSGVSTVEGLKLIKKAKSEGFNVSCDVPAYLFFLDESNVEGYDTRFKLDPPLKPKKTIESMIRFIVDGTIDSISSFHSPQDIESRDLEFDLASFGGSFLETSFASFWVGAGKKIDKKLIPDLFSLNASKILGIDLPIIEKGSEVNLSVFQLGSKWNYEGQEGREYTDPMAGNAFNSRVLGTILGKETSLSY